MGQCDAALGAATADEVARSTAASDLIDRMLHRVDTLGKRCTAAHMRIMNALEMVGRRRGHALRLDPGFARVDTAPSNSNLGAACRWYGVTTPARRLRFGASGAHARR